MKISKLNSWFLSSVMFACITFSVYSQNLPAGFRIDKLAQLDNPVSFAFANDGRMILLQQTGNVMLFKNGSLVNQNLVTLDSVYSGSEKGVLGVVFDPGFATNGFIYIYYTTNVVGLTYNGNVLVETNNQGLKPPIRNKIVRYTMAGDEILRSSKKTIIDLDIVPGFVVGVNHDGGSLRFGQDGKLYLAVGDGEQWCADACQNPNSSSCNCGSAGWITSSSANDNTSFHGKILRMNADGSAPIDNPFYSVSNATYYQKYFYAKGFRNPFTMNFKKGTNDLYINDIGSSGGGKREEINKITSTSIKHYGWQSPGGGEGILGNANYEDPIYSYLSGTNTITGCGIVGGTFYESVTGINAPWPAQYYNKYFFMDFCNGWINMLDINNGNAITNFASNMYSNVNNATSGMGNLYLEYGQDGNLYYLTRSVNSGQSGLYRISYQPNLVSSVTISGAANTITSQSGTIQFEGGVAPQNASINKINWSVSPTSIAGIGQNGLLTALSNGVATITGKSEANPTIIGISFVTITGQDAISGISITSPNTNTISINKGTLILTGNITPPAADQRINWAIVGSSPSGATAIVSANGVVSATGSNGVVTIIGASKVNAAFSQTIVISISGQNVSLTGLQISSNAGRVINSKNGTMQLTASYAPSNATNQNLNWTISNNTFASVSGTGLVTALADGVVTVTAKSQANSLLGASFVITVSGQTSTSIFAKNADVIDKKLMVYPNPNSGIFTVELDIVKGKDITIYVMSQLGSDMYSQEIKNFSGKTQVNLQSVAKGMYRVTVSYSLGSYHQVILVQ